MADHSDADLERLARVIVREALAQTVATPRQDLSDIAAAAARTAVNEAHIRMFAQLGFDLADKRDIKRLRADLEFLSAFRTNIGAVSSKALFTMTAILVSALVAAVWLGIKAVLHR